MEVALLSGMFCNEPAPKEFRHVVGVQRLKGFNAEREARGRKKIQAR